jgi:ABC-type multidrug transport system permease subunit
MIAYREQMSKAYKTFPFALSMVIAEMPYSILCAVGFFLPLYYIPGLNSSSSRAGYQFFMVFITEIFSVTLAQAIAALTPSPFISSLVNPFVIVIMALFCGVTIPKPQIIGFWRSWLYELNPFTRLIGGMIVTELHDAPVECTSMEFNRFSAPDGMDCGSYMRDFFANGAPGYILDNATSACQYCAYRVGDQFYQPLGYEFGNRWRDLGIFAAFIASNLCILFLAVSFTALLSNRSLACLTCADEYDRPAISTSIGGNTADRMELPVEKFPYGHGRLLWVCVCVFAFVELLEWPSYRQSS